MSDSNLYGTGRRKRSIARVFLKSGTGNILINGKNYKDYLARKSLATIVEQPLDLLELKDSYDININVNGGGLTGQAGAIRLGISRALNSINSDYRKIIKEKGFLTRDARKVERKKPGQPGARKNFQFSKR
ncbi:MAG: 30S ribosomal protein S9 [Candidatus Marinimicrobia bacterium]|nr:30S ribosomal protein S9 [Candidatus Neomarinimicrobiota bacterium]